ncbi:MAG: thioredoxin fold domain-containing protein [Gemmatales bacterium]|nr:thioredoxin fold domain-containing protein [Gemmatales bacterium]MDW8222517.1 thioredoxin fold domain-containing protein [Gemmatales bacterium]
MFWTRYKWVGGTQQRRQTSCWSLVLMLSLSGSTPAEVLAQTSAGIPWRTDYAQARREAREKHLPLLLDFTTEWCVHCQRMDATTFQDVHVIDLLARQFIPVKIDASRQPSLAEALRIRGYPTLVLALPDGRIVHTLEGYVDAAQLTPYLRSVVAQSATGSEYAQKLEEAVRAQSAGEYAQAVAHLNSLLSDPQALAVHLRAKSVLEQIEQQARREWDEERGNTRQRSTEERERAWQQLAQRFAGTSVAAEIRQALAQVQQARQAELAQRRQQAVALLQAARSDFEQQNWLACLERCDRLLRDFSDLPEGKQAQALLNQIKAQPEHVERTCDRLIERLGELHLALAESWLRQGEPQLAIATYHKIVTRFSGTRFAEIAQVRLKQLTQDPFQQTQFTP